MKTMLLASATAIAMLFTATQSEAAGPFAKNSTFKLKLRSITKTENNVLKPGMKVFPGAPKGLVAGKTYEFKIGSKFELTETKSSGINISYASDARLGTLNLSYLKALGATCYADKKSSGTFNLNTFIEFGSAYQLNKKGLPVALTLTYIDAKITPSFSTKQIIYVFEKP